MGLAERPHVREIASVLWILTPRQDVRYVQQAGVIHAGHRACLVVPGQHRRQELRIHRLCMRGRLVHPGRISVRRPIRCPRRIGPVLFFLTNGGSGSEVVLEK